MQKHPEMIYLSLEERKYKVYVHRRVSQPVEHPRLAIVSFQPNRWASEILRVCIRSIQRLTPEPHELWVVDNNSPWHHTAWLLHKKGINLALNRTHPIPPGKRTLWHRLKRFYRPTRWGSYANAIGLELATCLIEPSSKYLMTLHMDILAGQKGWLSYIRSKLNDKVKAAGFYMQRFRYPQGIAHILGCLVDFQTLKKLNLSFYPDLPRLDVGDAI